MVYLGWRDFYALLVYRSLLSLSSFLALTSCLKKQDSLSLTGN